MKVILVITILSLSQSLWAQKISMVTTEWSPFYGSNLENKGVLTEIINHAFQVKGYETTLNFVPWARALKEVKTGRSDILMGVWHSKEREKDYLYSDKLLSNRIVFVKHKDSDFTFNELSDLKGKNVGILANYAYAKEFNDATDFKKIKARNLETNLKKVAAKRLDLTLDDEIVIKDEIQRNLPHLKSKLEFSKKAIDEKGIYITVGLKNPNAQKIIKDFNAGLIEIKSNGVYSKLLRKHGF